MPSTESFIANLTAGHKVGELGVPVIGDKFDLRRMKRASKVQRRPSTTFRGVEELAGTLSLERCQIESSDFTGSDLSSIRLTSCVIAKCTFRECNMSDLRTWDTHFVDCDFGHANLRKSALGGVVDGKRNKFESCRFEQSDFRGAAITEGRFSQCSFVGSRLVSLDFGGTIFDHCTFSGELVDVSFRKRPIGRPDAPANTMSHVDFSQARFRHVDFYDLELNDVTWPAGPGHIVVDNFGERMSKLGALFERDPSPNGRAAAAYFKIMSKMSPPGRRTGVLVVEDMHEVLGDEVCRQVLGTLSQMK